VPALSGQRDPHSISVRFDRNHDRDAQPAAGADNADRRAGDGRAAADLPAAIGPDARNRQRHRDKIVDDVEMVEPDFVCQARDRERPGMIGERQVIAGHRPGHRDGADLGARLADNVQTVEIGQDRIAQRGVRRHRQNLDRGGDAILKHGEARVRGPDIADQRWLHRSLPLVA
jgi:hypothetical protein